MENTIPANNCGVSGCKHCKRGQNHWCKTCKTIRSDHYNRNCPYKDYDLVDLAKTARKRAEETSDIMCVNGDRFFVDFWTDPHTVFFGLDKTPHKPLNAGNF